MDDSLALDLSQTIFNWTLFAVATGLATWRYNVRYYHTGSLRADDWVHLAALSALFIYNTVSTIDDFADWNPDLNAVKHLFWILSPIIWMTYTLTIYLSKAVFLALYFKIFGVSGKFRVMWWCAVVITFLGYAVEYIGTFLLCGDGFDSYKEEICENLTSTAQHIHSRQILTSVLPDMTTDIIIMLLPLSMLPKLHTTRSRKTQLLPIILLGLISVTISLTSYILGDGPVSADISPSALKSRRYAASLLLFGEPGICVITAALPAIVFVPKNRRHIVTLIKKSSEGAIQGKGKTSDVESGHYGKAFTAREHMPTGINELDLIASSAVR